MSLLLKIFREFFNNEYDFLFYAVFTSILAWLFINIKNRLEYKENEKLKRVDLSIKNYYLLISSLKCYRKNREKHNIEKINQLISDVLPYVSKEFSIVLMNWEIESIEEVINNLKRMINELKNFQYNTLNNYSNLTMGKLFYDFINSSGMKIFIIASIYSVLVELGLMIFFQYILNSIGKNFIETIYINIRLIYFIFLTCIIFLLLDRYYTKQYNKLSKEFIIQVSIVLIPLFIIIVLTKINYLKIAKRILIFHLILLFLTPLIIKKSRLKQR